MDSILTSIKKMLGIDEAYTIFDPDIIICINSVFTILTQLGVGPAEGFKIEDEDDEWSDFLPDNSNLELVKSYMHLKVKLLFDPPSSSVLLESMNKLVKESEFRLNVEVDPE